MDKGTMASYICQVIHHEERLNPDLEALAPAFIARRQRPGGNKVLRGLKLGSDPQLYPDVCARRHADYTHEIIRKSAKGSRQGTSETLSRARTPSNR